MIYSGVGSRKTPREILEIMFFIAERMAVRGHLLRSGGAPGADSAFESGCDSASGAKEIFYARHATPESMELAGSLHPAWHRCGIYARKLHGRNSFQILGADLQSPSSGVICWTPDGCLCHESRSIRTGGTGTAISIASSHGIPVWNLARPDHLAKWREWLN